MGAVKRIAVTGATGFLGRAVVAQARRRGHAVRSLVRREGVGDHVLDLADESAQPRLRDILASVDVVIHCAGAVSGSDAVHARDTIRATENLYEALPGGVPVVLAGSLAVHPGMRGMVTETTPIETRPEGRDAYARAKLAQERIAADHAGRGADTCIMRLGALWDEGHLWNAHIGLRMGPILLRMDTGGELPLVHVEDAARAMVMAAEQPVPAGISVLDIVGDYRPAPREWLRRLPAEQRPRLTLPLPWPLLMPLAQLGRLLPVQMPGLLRPETLRYRMAPRVYGNARAKAALGWQPEGGR